ncbi:hypothetical protein H4582DRAFT_2099732 [Lactarius indigo]|nr:hypothetical protein H4582DRAFT_2099732 [Lactarius indigo]
MKHKVIQILLVFCQVHQSDVHVRNALGTRKVGWCELANSSSPRVPGPHAQGNQPSVDEWNITRSAAKCKYYLDPDPNPRRAKEQSSGPRSTGLSNHIFQTYYNLCRLNMGREEEVAQAGALSPLFYATYKRREELPDIATAARCMVSTPLVTTVPISASRNASMIPSPPFLRLQEETAQVEDEVAIPKSLDALLKCFVPAKAGSFENLLDSFLNICRHSTRIAIGIAKAQFFRRVTEKLSNGKAAVKLNSLRILRAVCDVHPNRALLVERYGIHETVAVLRRKDGAVLVRELAREIEPSLALALKPSLREADTPKSSIAPKRRTTRRTASDTSGIGTPSPPLGTGPINNPRVTSAGAGLGAGTTRGLSAAFAC